MSSEHLLTIVVSTPIMVVREVDDHEQVDWLATATVNFDGVQAEYLGVIPDNQHVQPGIPRRYLAQSYAVRHALEHLDLSSGSPIWLQEQKEQR